MLSWQVWAVIQAMKHQKFLHREIDHQMVMAKLERTDNHLKKIFLNLRNGHRAFIILIHSLKSVDHSIKTGRFFLSWLIIALNLEHIHSKEIP